jgi:hypothetical protein
MASAKMPNVEGSKSKHDLLSGIKPNRPDNSIILVLKLDEETGKKERRSMNRRGESSAR